MADKKMSKDDMIEAIKGMTVIELSELVKALEEEFGVSAAAPSPRPQPRPPRPSKRPPRRRPRSTSC